MSAFSGLLASGHSVSRSHWQLWLALVAVALTMTALAAANIYLPGDVALATTVQDAHGAPGLGYVSKALYEFGLVYPLAALAVASFVSLRGNLLAAAFVGIAAALRPLGTIVKELVERPRPTQDLVTFVEGASGFSFPSGHVFGTVLLVGFIGYLAARSQHGDGRRLLFAAAAGAFMLLMGLQRVYAGAHWPSDVLAAYIWGGIVLFVLIKTYRFLSHRVETRPSLL